MKPVEWLRAALLVFLGVAAFAQESRGGACAHDTAIPFLQHLAQRRSPEAAYFRDSLSAPIHECCNLLVAWGNGSCWRDGKAWAVREALRRAPPGGAPSWAPDSLLGLFLQERENPDRVHELTVVRNPALADAHFVVERLTESEIVLKHLAGKGDSRFPSIGFFFDAAAKRFRGQAVWRHFRAAAVAGGRQPPQFVLRNDRRAGPFEDPSVRILVFRPAEDGGFEPVPESEWAPEIDDEFGGGGSDASGPLRFGPEGRFSVETVEDGYRSRKAVGVREGADLYPLPVSDAGRRRGARPEKHASGYGQWKIDEAIGHRQVFADRLWFGKTFYDSEGYAGAGGFGYFDMTARRYVIFSPPAVRDYSVSALLVEEDTLWLGLKQRGEYGDRSGGLLRWDIAGGRLPRLFDAPLVSFIARWRGGLYLGTAEGLAVVKGNRVENYSVRQGPDGGFELARPLVLNSSGQAQPAY